MKTKASRYPKTSRTIKSKNGWIGKILYFVDRASRYNTCQQPNWRTFSMYLFIYSTSLHVSSNPVLIVRKIELYQHIIRYTGCPRRNVPDFGRVFLMLKYTDITQNTYIQSWTVTEIMAREVWNFDSCYTLTDYQIHITTGRNMWFL